MPTAFDYDFHIAQVITQDRQFTFYPCLIAAFQQADDVNLAILKSAFPGVFESFRTNQQISRRVALNDWKEEKKLVKGACREDE